MSTQIKLLAIEYMALTTLAFNKKNTLFASKLDLNLRNKLVNCYNLSRTTDSAETWELQKIDQKDLKSFEIWCWE
jgi:hypothetical protein